MDGEVDLEVELVSALSELKKERKKKNLLKKELCELKEAPKATTKRQTRSL